MFLTAFENSMAARWDGVSVLISIYLPCVEDALVSGPVFCRWCGLDLIDDVLVSDGDEVVAYVDDVGSALDGVPLGPALEATRGGHRFDLPA